MACVSRRHHAVEEINAPCHRFNDIAGRTDAHEIPRFLLRRIIRQHIQNVIHRLRRLAHRKAANGNARHRHIPKLLHVPDPKIVVGAALVDTKEYLTGIHRIRQLIQPVQLLDAPFQPPLSPFHGILHVLSGGRILHAFVKGHGNIRAKIGLNLHTLFRSHKDLVAIQMRGKRHALFGNFPQTRQ